MFPQMAPQKKISPGSVAKAMVALADVLITDSLVKAKTVPDDPVVKTLLLEPTFLAILDQFEMDACSGVSLGRGGRRIQILEPIGGFNLVVDTDLC